jgi:hypothetical protein
MATARQILEQPDSPDDWDSDLKAKRLYRSALTDVLD